MRALRRNYMVTAIFCVCVLISPAAADEISNEGRKLLEKLDSMDVERLWEPGRSVAWKTGKLLEKQGEFRRSNTHCSAFVAATCLQMNIYILRPPEHETKNLANAQTDWLRDKGPEFGWKPVATSADAQHFANKGRLVVVAFKESNPERNGHIAIVRPSQKSTEKIQLEGPQITQAGAMNSSNTTVKEGFKHHVGAFPNGVRYYVHEQN